MGNSFVKKEKELKNRNMNKSVNSKVDEMAERIKASVHDKDIKVINYPKDVEEEIDEKSLKQIKDFTVNTYKIPKEDFFDLKIQMDRFDGSNTSVTIGINIYEKIKNYSDLKNYTINFFVNKLIRVALEDIEHLSVEDIQKSMCYTAKTRSLPFQLDGKIEYELNYFTEKMKLEGYKFSRNSIICAMINKTLSKFHH